MSLAHSYAKALLEAATEMGQKREEILKLETELESFLGALRSSHELATALGSPLLSIKEKQSVVDAIAKKTGLSPLTSRFLMLVAGKDRATELFDIVAAFKEERIEAEGGLLGDVVSADPITDADLEDLSRGFTKKFGKRVQFRTHVDPQLLAGLKVTVQGTTYDGSLRAQLDQVKNLLIHQ